MVEVHQDIELDRLRRISQANADGNEMHQQESVAEIEQVSLPPTDREGVVRPEPKEIMARRMKKKGGKDSEMVQTVIYCCASISECS